MWSGTFKSCASASKTVGMTWKIFRKKTGPSDAGVQIQWLKPFFRMMMIWAVIAYGGHALADEPPVSRPNANGTGDVPYQDAGKMPDLEPSLENVDNPMALPQKEMPVSKKDPDEFPEAVHDTSTKGQIRDIENIDQPVSDLPPKPEDTVFMIERTWPKPETLGPEMLPPSLPARPDETLVPDAIRSIDPAYTRALTAIETGRNDANPIWSPHSDRLAFERGMGDRREIIVTDRAGGIQKTIYYQIPEKNTGMDFYFPGITDSTSYNADMSWSSDGQSLAFMSNGGSGNYDLYLLQNLENSQPIRLTRHPGKDSHPHWSPAGGRLAFVSGRTGKANIFTMDLATRRTTQMTRGPKMYLYPSWSPDGNKIAMIYGSNENHDIYVIENLTRPFDSIRALTDWPHDDLRPVWSPDGTKIAFYSNYNLKNDPKSWCIMVIPSQGVGPDSKTALTDCVVATQVIPDIETGPAWMPNSRHIVFVKNDPQAFNPIFLVNIDERIPAAVNTETKMNHDVTCATDGTLAFRTQVRRWDHIYVAGVTPDLQSDKEPE